MSLKKKFKSRKRLRVTAITLNQTSILKLIFEHTSYINLMTSHFKENDVTKQS